MKVYYHGRHGNHRIYVQPANHQKDAPSEWKDSEGKPKMIEIVFKDGVADVPSNLGQYLIDNNFASKSKIFLPFKEVVKA